MATLLTNSSRETVMSEETAELWARAKDGDDEPAELEAELAALNRGVDWDRANLSTESSDEREQLAADD
ncbi:hypothetical protein GCM10008995_08370 [Halobellus salinus]|uniref:Uncharacterized protein n=2 Tax=Halobellus salinus TaxID=931585 RepID=A0A830E826_9EURY|nr:hypothetical protein GCM10008995_08370 [Halobellus salinus]